MAKKKTGERNDAWLKCRCRSADVKAFRRAAEAEGFAGNVSAWALYHLRREAGVSGRKGDR